MARLVSLACFGLLLALAAWVCGGRGYWVNLAMSLKTCGFFMRRWLMERHPQSLDLKGELLEWLDSDKFNSLGHLETTAEPQDWSLDAGIYGTSAERSQDFSQSHVETDRDSSEGEFQLQKWSPRSRRDAGPAKVCCKWGCTKSELAKFC
ncbi:relaxin-3-like [Huso huso]|uniref:Relaxin-3-like n=1 Tax=Huso huso TaxID=61971 RepID=A0ABR0Y3W8_HUSHU